MNVCVGAFSDPQGLQGLAHFLVHMLFYANEKYPLEDSYSKYITGAWWEYELLSHLLSNPTTSLKLMLTVLKKLWTEHQKNLLYDVWRMNQIQKHLSEKDHHLNKFSAQFQKHLSEKITRSINSAQGSGRHWRCSQKQGG